MLGTVDRRFIRTGPRALYTVPWAPKTYMFRGFFQVNNLVFMVLGPHGFYLEPKIGPIILEDLTHKMEGQSFNPPKKGQLGARYM